MLPVPLTVNWYWLECPPCLSSWFALGIQEGAPIANTVSRVIPFTFYASEKRICKGSFRQYPFGITRPLEVRPIFWKRWMMFSPRFPVGLLTWNFIPKKSTSTPLNTLSMASLTRGLQDRHSPLPPHTAPAICSILLSWHMHSILLWVAHLPLSIRTQLLLSSSGLLPHMQPTT